MMVSQFPGTLTDYFRNNRVQLINLKQINDKICIPHIIFRAELPFGTHRDSPYDDMEKFRYLPTVMLTSGKGSRPLGQIRSRNV